MPSYTIYYTSNPDAIPDGAIKVKQKMDTIGTVYLINRSEKTDIYLNYSIGMKIDKPTILKVEEQNGVVNIEVRRPDKAVKNKVNYHCFRFEFDKKIDEVHLMEFV